MAVTETLTFETGPEGATVVAGVGSGITQVSGAVLYRAADKAFGTFGVGIAAASNASFYLRKDIAPHPLTHSMSMFYTMKSLSASTTTVVRFADATNLAVCSIAMSSDLKFRILDGTGTSVQASTFLWTPGTQYRFDWQLDYSNPTSVGLTVQIFEGDNALPVATLFAGSIPNSLTLARWMIGQVGTGAGGATRHFGTDHWRIADGLEAIGPVNPVPPTPTAVHLGAGGATHESVRLRALVTNAVSARFAISTAPDLSGAVFTTAAAPTADGYVLHQKTGLADDTTYYYRVELDGVQLGNIGTFRTLQTPGSTGTPEDPWRMRIVVGSCAINGSNDPVFDVMRTLSPAPDLFVHLGDRGYPWSGVQAPNSAVPVTAGFEAPWEQPRQLALAEAMAMDYMFSDTDGQGSQADGTFPSTPAHRAAFRKMIPSWDLDASPTSTLHRGAVTGRVRILHTDHRTGSSAKGDADSSSKTYWGATQEAWFLDQLDQAVANRELVLWFGDNEWVGSPNIDGNVDQPRAYPTWRQGIADEITARGMAGVAAGGNGQLQYFFGDTHALAADDGTGNAYGSFPRWCSSPFHQQSNVYIFPNSQGHWPLEVEVAGHAFTVIDIIDDGDTIRTESRGYTADMTERIAFDNEFEPFQLVTADAPFDGEGTLLVNPTLLEFAVGAPFGGEGTLTATAEAPGSLPPFPDYCWPVDTSCCADAWAEYDSLTKARATALAGQTMRMLTGWQVGGCPITIRPCKAADCAGNSWHTYAEEGYGGYGQQFQPTNLGGTWLNIPCCDQGRDCSCTKVCEIKLPTPVGPISEIRIDGEIVDPATYRIDNGEWLVRQGTDECWPTCQDMSAPAGAPNTFTVTYLNGFAVDGLSAYAAGVLACEFALACTGQACRLPRGVTQVARQGVNITLQPASFTNGLTGIAEVDVEIMRWNPHLLKAPARIIVPGRRAVRRTTWDSGA